MVEYPDFPEVHVIPNMPIVLQHLRVYVFRARLLLSREVDVLDSYHILFDSPQQNPEHLGIDNSVDGSSAYYNFTDVSILLGSYGESGGHASIT